MHSEFSKYMQVPTTQKSPAQAFISFPSWHQSNCPKDLTGQNLFLTGHCLLTCPYLNSCPLLQAFDLDTFCDKICYSVVCSFAILFQFVNAVHPKMIGNLM